MRFLINFSCRSRIDRARYSAMRRSCRTAAVKHSTSYRARSSKSPRSTRWLLGSDEGRFRAVLCNVCDSGSASPTALAKQVHYVNAVHQVCLPLNMVRFRTTHLQTSCNFNCFFLGGRFGDFQLCRNPRGPLARVRASIGRGQLEDSIFVRRAVVSGFRILFMSRGIAHGSN